jgi:hypothetical protein
MKPLGNCLVFRLKYAPDVRHLTEDLEPDVEGLKDHAVVQDRLEAVCQRAGQEAADFLLECHQAVFPHLEGIAEVTLKSPPDARSWTVKYEIRSARHPGNRSIEMGIHLSEEPAVVAVYRRTWGGRPGEDAVIRILGKRVVGRSRDWDGYSGTVALARVPIPLPAGHQFEVDSETLVAAMREAVLPLTRDQMDAILAGQPPR